jgi:hypothetical protein
MIKTNNILKEFKMKYEDGFNVSEGVHVSWWSDIHSYTIIKRTPKSIIIQRDDVVLLNGADSGEIDTLKFNNGGFCANVTGTQRYEITPNDKNGTTKATLRKNGEWKLSHGNYSTVKLGRYEYYDYNF